MELGVKFRSDVAGTITGIRFYKASTNTGTHVGTLWSSTGTNLATVTFTGETGSGWQQMLFSSPVAITANTVYVASYHANTGHYSADVNYFATTGVDNPPLHALANGVSGGNGVFAYGTTPAFPTQTWNAANYWVDVVFSPASAPTLQSIAVTPTNPTLLTGATQQFTATGTYSDSSTQNLTSTVTWTSASPTVATIGAGGLATGVSAGTTAVSATLNGTTGSTTLTVQTAPPAPTLSSIAVTPANPTILDGGDAAVHGDRDLLGQFHADPDRSGHLGLLEYRLCHDYHRYHRRVGNWHQCREHHHLGNLGSCHRQHNADGAGRAA